MPKSIIAGLNGRYMFQKNKFFLEYFVYVCWQFQIGSFFSSLSPLCIPTGTKGGGRETPLASTASPAGRPAVGGLPDLETDGLHHVCASQGWCSAILGFSEMLKPDSIFFHSGPLIFDSEAIL